MKNKYKTCQRFVICLQFYKSHAFNEVIEYSENKCRHLLNEINISFVVIFILQFDKKKINFRKVYKIIK